jgi:hypothetical protein
VALDLCSSQKLERWHLADFKLPFNQKIKPVEARHPIYFDFHDVSKIYASTTSFYLYKHENSERYEVSYSMNLPFDRLRLEEKG